MSVTIEIYSEAYDEFDDVYADYSPLLKKLPAIAYYPPEPSEPNRFFQGSVVVSDLEFIRSLMNQLECSVQLENAPDGQLADLQLFILDAG